MFLFGVFKGMWGGRVVGLGGGGIVIAGASSWSRPFIRVDRNGSMSIGQACNQLVPVLFVQCFPYPVLEGAVFVDGNFRYVSKEEAEVFDNEVFVVKEGTSNSANSVAACGQHLLCWPIRWSANNFPKEV